MTTALVVIDMQNDFCAPYGWVFQLGESIAETRAVIPPIAALLLRWRAAERLAFHTREGHRPDLSDLNPNKQWRTRKHGLGIGDTGERGRVLVRGDQGCEIIPELEPWPGEPVVDKPGKSAFHATGFEGLLRRQGVTALLIAGVTTDCCVQSTARDAVDLGFGATILADCCAAVERPNHEATLRIIARGGGAYGQVSTAAEALAALGVP
jgi:nicotinamidase-related amidase